MSHVSNLIDHVKERQHFAQENIDRIYSLPAVSNPVSQRSRAGNIENWKGYRRALEELIPVIKKQLLRHPYIEFWVWLAILRNLVTRVRHDWEPSAPDVECFEADFMRGLNIEDALRDFLDEVEWDPDECAHILYPFQNP